MVCSFSKICVSAGFGSTNGMTTRQWRSEWKPFNRFSNWQRAGCLKRKWKNLIRLKKPKLQSRMLRKANAAAKSFSSFSKFANARSADFLVAEAICQFAGQAQV